MVNRSMTDWISAVVHYGGQYTTTQTPASGVDLKTYGRAEIMVAVATIANIQGSPVGPGWTFALEDSADNVTFAACDETDVVMPSGDVIGANGIFGTIDDSDDDNKVFNVGYVGPNRYVRVVATAVSTPGASDIMVIVVGCPLLTDVN